MFDLDTSDPAAGPLDARFVNTATLGGDLYAVVDDYDHGEHRFGPLVWTPGPGGVLPQAGDRALIAESANGDWWVLAWEPTGAIPPAGGGDLTYTHSQDTPATTWVVTHNLGKHPSVTVVDTAGTVVIGQIQHDSLNQVTLTFSAPFGGKAYLN